MRWGRRGDHRPVDGFPTFDRVFTSVSVQVTTPQSASLTAPLTQGSLKKRSEDFGPMRRKKILRLRCASLRMTKSVISASPVIQRSAATKNPDPRPARRRKGSLVSAQPLAACCLTDAAYPLRVKGRGTAGGGGGIGAIGQVIIFQTCRRFPDLRPGLHQHFGTGYNPSVSFADSSPYTGEPKWAL